MTHMDGSTEDTWLTIDAVAEALDVNPRTIRRYVRDGKLAQVKFARQVVRIRPEELERFMADNIKIATGTGGCYVPRQDPVDVSD